MIVSQKTNKIYDNWEELAKNVSQYLPKYKENVIPHGITLLWGALLQERLSARKANSLPVVSCGSVPCLDGFL